MRVAFDPQAIQFSSFCRLMTAVVVPLPIAWVSTVAADGTANLAPARFHGKR
ncbi:MULTISPECIES: hypothetical protein [unclassified Streptomyces]|uniref:hypothetical protein n=1 Tax=unclassified Streptomyces TaxID=2593676 RepID=UPI0036EDB60A